MSSGLHITSKPFVSVLFGLASMCAAVCRGSGESEAAAVNAIGRGDAAVLQLVREVTEWKSRAEAAESLLTAAGIPNSVQPRSGRPMQAQVMSTLESERVLIISAGKLSGAVLGALVSVGDGVVAKVVESRETVSAAILDQKYQGRVGALEGSHVRLLVVRP